MFANFNIKVVFKLANTIAVNKSIVHLNLKTRIMCYQCELESGINLQMAALNQHHLKKIQEVTDTETAIFAEKVFKAWTKSLRPHLPLLPMFVAMFEALRNKDYGVLGKHKLIRVPLSIIGDDKVRYRLPIVSLLHETILSANMSDISKDYFRQSLNNEGLCVLFMCSCGVVLGKCRDINNFYGSHDHLAMDKLRSAIDAQGNPVREVSSWDSIPLHNMDIHANGAERRLFDRIIQLTEIASYAQVNKMAWVDEEISRFVQIAQIDPVVAYQS